MCELFPDNLEAWVRWIEGLDPPDLGYRPVQASGRKVLVELCYRVGWDPGANAHPDAVHAIEAFWERDGVDFEA